MHGRSIEGQRKLERKSEANLLEPMSLEDLLSQWNQARVGVAQMRFGARLAALEAKSLWKKLSIPLD
jgi:hypothetical protein